MEETKCEKKISETIRGDKHGCNKGLKMGWDVKNCAIVTQML